MNELMHIEKEAQENQRIAQHEREVAKKSKNNALVEIKRSKARENLMKIEYQLAKIKKELAEKRNFLAKEKIKIKKNQIIDFPEEELKIESEYAVYNEKIAENDYKIHCREMFNLFHIFLEYSIVWTAKHAKKAKNEMISIQII